MGTWLGLGKTLILESKTKKEKTGYLKDLKSKRNTAQDMAVNKTAKWSGGNDLSLSHYKSFSIPGLRGHVTI